MSKVQILRKPPFGPGTATSTSVNHLCASKSGNSGREDHEDAGPRSPRCRHLHPGDGGPVPAGQRGPAATSVRYQPAILRNGGGVSFDDTLAWLAATVRHMSAASTVRNCRRFSELMGELRRSVNCR